MRVMQSIQRLLRNMILKSPVYSSGMTTTQLHHIFFHTLIVDPEKTFDVSLSSKAQVIAYNEAMTTIDEFVKIIQKMYDDGYVLVGLHDVAEW